MPHNINDWLSYNGNEYTVNGKTYRNLEEQVRRNQEVSKEAYDTVQDVQADVVQLGEDISALEDTVSALGKTIKLATIYTTTYNEIKQWSDNGHIVIASTMTPPLVNNGINFVMTLIDSTKAEFSAVGETDIAVATVDTSDVWTLTTVPIGGKGAFQAIFNTTPFSEVKQAYDDQRIVYCVSGGLIYYLTFCTSTTANFTHVRLYSSDGQSGASIRNMQVNSTDGWEISTQMLVSNSLQPGATSQIPTSKAVADYVAQHGSSVAQVYVRDDGEGGYIADKTYAEISDIIDADEDILLTYSYKYFRFNRFRTQDSTYGYPYVFTCTDGFPYNGQIETFYVENTDEWHHHTLTIDPIPTSTAILSGDRVMVGRAVDQDDTQTVGTLTFDTSVTDKFLCQDGTWKTVEGPIPVRQLSEAAMQHTLLPAVTLEVEVNP